MKGCPDFGGVRGNPAIAPGKDGCAYIFRSPIGNAITEALSGLERTFPALQVYQYCIMPDHVHLLIHIRERTEFRLSDYINHLKAQVGLMCRSSVNEIFEERFTDKLLYHNRSLEVLFRYIRENPHRLAMRRQYPQFFQHVRNVRIAEVECSAYGNLFLLNNPDKMAIKVSRKDSDADMEKKVADAVEGALTGTVLVSPFISPREREIRLRAEEFGARIILITHEAFGDRYKPPAHEFELCSDGRLLILSMGKPPDTPLTREMCLEMNAFASAIAAGR